MGNYIVFDLEWNQGKSVKERNGKSLPFEIIEIGAVRLDENRNKTGEFSRLVRPQVYKKMHKITEDLIHITMEDLQSGDDFVTRWKRKLKTWQRLRSILFPLMRQRKW